MNTNSMGYALVWFSLASGHCLVLGFRAREKASQVVYLRLSAFIFGWIASFRLPATILPFTCPFFAPAATIR
jgi:hypothetical protein